MISSKVPRQIFIVLVISVFAVVATYLLQMSRAAVNGVAVEAESGTLTNAVVQPDAEASNGSSVSFTAAPTPEPTMPPMNDQIPLDQLPKGNAGSGSALIASGAPMGDPTPTWASAFRIECGFSHMNYDDPIVYPGQQGKAHLHTFFGNTGANYLSTYDSLRNTGNSTCSGGILNRSAYWVPTLMNGATPIAPTKIVTYYKSGYPSVPFATLRDIPSGLRMITGTATSTGNQNTQGQTFIEWYCNSNSGGTIGPIVPTCNTGDEVVLTIDFPQCWDGVNLDSANHKSHVSRPQSFSGSGCPSTHPIPFPHITFIVHWPVTSGTSAGYRLSSDMYPTTSPGGYSAHADYMEGWDPTIRQTFLNSCLIAGKDCQVRWLGDGRTLQNPAGVN